MKKIILKSAIIIGAATPLLAFAQQKNLAYLVSIAVQYLGYAVYLIMGLAIVMFVWNVYKYFIAGGDNAEKKGEAGMYVMWSVIGFFVILSFWGLVNILTNTIKLDNYTPATGIFGSFRSTGGTTNYGVFNNTTTNTNTNTNTGTNLPGGVSNGALPGGVSNGALPGGVSN